MKLESFQEESVPEQTPEELKVLKDESRARKVLVALTAALGISIATQPSLEDLHRNPLSPPEASIASEKGLGSTPPGNFQETVDIETGHHVVNIDLSSQTEVKNINLDQPVVHMKPPQ